MVAERRQCASGAWQEVRTSSLLKPVADLLALFVPCVQLGLQESLAPLVSTLSS